MSDSESELKEGDNEEIDIVIDGKEYVAEPIDCCDNYYVTHEGKIFNFTTKRFIKPDVHKNRIL